MPINTVVHVSYIYQVTVQLRKFSAIPRPHYISGYCAIRTDVYKMGNSTEPRNNDLH